MDIIPFTMINLTLCFVNNLTALKEIIGGARNFWIHLKGGGYFEPPAGLEPATGDLQNRYSTN